MTHQDISHRIGIIKYFHMASNVLGGNAEETDKAPKSGLKNAAAGIALGVTLALAGTPAGAAETTAQMEAAREMCLADSKAKSTSLLKLAETKRAAAAEFEKAGEGEKAKVEMEKVAKLEKKFQELVESCMELVVVQNRSREADARIASADAKIASADADIIKLDRIKKEGDEINLEFQTLTQALNDYSIGKITAEQFKSKITNV